MKPSIVLLLLMVLSIVSCRQIDSQVVTDWDLSFGESQKITSVPCMDEELILGSPLLLQYADSSLLIYDHLADSLFLLVDLADNNRIYRFGQRGQGANDFLQVFSFCRTESDSVIGVYDAYRHHLRELNLHQVKKMPAAFPVLAEDTILSFKLFSTKYGDYLGTGFYGKGILSLAQKGQGTRFYFEYPYRDKKEKEITNQLRALAYQGEWCVSPSLDKCLYAVRNAPIIMIFSVTETGVEKKYEWIAGYPEYKPEKNESYSAAPMSADNKLSFISAYVTDKFIYLAYSGKSIREAQTDAFQTNVIYQLSWDGKPVRKLELDFMISKFCVTDDDKCMYAMANKGELELVKYEL